MTTRFADPLAAWKAFAEAAHASDPDAAQAASTPEGWRRHGDSALTVYGQAQEGFRLQAVSAPIIEGDRAVLLCDATRTEAAGRTRRLYALLQAHDGRWGVSAALPSERQAALFLRGELPAVVHPLDLPEHAELAAWANAKAASATHEALLTLDDIAQVSGCAPLGALPIWSETGASAFDALSDEEPAVLALGQLAQSLLALPKAVAIAELGAHEGGAPAVAHLAQVVAALGQATLLIDLHTQRPSLHAIFERTDPGPGLTDWLTEACTVDEAVHTVRSGLDLLPAGRGGALNGPAFQRFVAWLAEAVERYDRVLVLCPTQGLAPLADAAKLAPILALQPGVHPAQQVEHVAAPLRQAGRPLAGFIATRVTPESLPLDLPPALAGSAEGRRRHVEVLGAPWLASRDRAMIGLRVTYEGDPSGTEEWEVYDVRGRSLTPVTTGSFASISLLTHDLEVALPPVPAPKLDAGEQLAKGLANAFEGLLGGLKGTRSTDAVSSANQLPGALAELLASTLEQAGSSPEAKALREQVAQKLASPDEPAQPTAEMPGNANRIPDVLRSRFHTYAAQHIGDPEQVVVDANFLNQHGPALAADMVKGVAEEVFDKPVDMDIGQGSKVKLDLGSILRGLTSSDQ